MLSNFRLILKRFPWVLPTLTLLGLFSSLMEGIGIGLFVPFLNTMVNNTTASTGSRYLDALNSLLMSWPTTKRIFIIGGCIFGTVLIKSILVYISARVSSSATNRLVNYLRGAIHQQILRVSLGYLDALEPGYLMNLVGSQTFRTMMALFGVNTLLTTGAYTLVFLILLLLISWKLTLVVGALLALASRFLRLVQRRAETLSREISTTQTVLSNLLHETIGGARDIRSFGREQFESDRFATACQAATDAVLQSDILNAAVPPMTELVATAILCGVLFIAVPLVSTNFVGDLPKIMAFALMLYRLQPQFKGFEQARVNVASYLDGLADINTFLETIDKPYLQSGTRSLGKLSGCLKLEDVSFRYQPEHDDALQHVTLTIPMGKTTAIIGPSGSGKTTLASLLVRFYDPTAGRVLVDDVPLASLDLDWWHSQLGMVGQQLFLFNDTIAANIAYGKLDATSEEIEEAARQAHAHDFIMSFPGGYATVVGDRGVRLSGGQRQRLALARAIVRKPQIFVLDEATSALDSLSEKFVQEALAALGQAHTIVIIAHRLSTVEEADHMIVLDHGRVTEEGNPQALLKSEGLYTLLYAMQHKVGVAEPDMV